MSAYLTDPTFLQRLRAGIQRGEPNECWPWTKGHTGAGYGQLGYGRRRVLYTHRVAWEIANNRTLEPGEHVCHVCDNPPCCNPAHLFVGSQADNLADARRKQRLNNRGENCSKAKLTEGQVRDLVRRYLGGEWGSDLAKEFGVIPTTVSHILLGDRWGHLWTDQELAHMRTIASQRRGRGRWRRKERANTL